MTSLFSKSSLYGISTACNIGIQLVMIPILLRNISIEEYGVVGLYLGLVAIFTAVLPMSSENALARSVFEKNENLNRQVFETANAVVIIIFVSSLVLIIGIRRWLSETLFLISLLALLSSFLQVFTNFILVQLQMRERVVSYFLISISQAILILGLTIYWLPTFGVWARYTSPIFALLFILVSYCLLTNFKYVHLKLGILGWDYVRNVGFPLAPHSLLNVSSLYIDRFFLKIFNYDVLLGFYTISSQLINAVGGALSSVNNAYTPWIFNRLGQQKSLNFIALIGAFALACIFMMMLIFWVIPLVPDSKYAIIVNSLYLIPIYVFFESTYYLTCPLLYFKKLGTSISIATFISAVIKFALLGGYLLSNSPTMDGILTILIASVAIKTLMTLFFVKLNYKSISK